MGTLYAINKPGTSPEITGIIETLYFEVVEGELKFHSEQVTQLFSDEEDYSDPYENYNIIYLDSLT